ncbi:MAG: porin [Gammaproteobacteria bacterium]|nr:porin [Gammaproteobacteria bacterium]
MKFRTTAIAMAVAGIVAAPMAAQADGEVYGSVRVGLFYQDKDTEKEADFRVDGISSRVGMKGETDLGNGLTGYGRYEAGVDESELKTRHLFAGLKGDWGSVEAGQTWHTWYDMIVGPLDNPAWTSGVAMVEYRGRTDSGITYAGGGGNINFSVTGYFDEDKNETAPDGLEAAVTFGLGDSTIALGYSSVDEDGALPTQGNNDTDKDIIALAWYGIGIGDTTLGVSFMTQDGATSDGDIDGIVLDWGIGNAYAHLETLMTDDNDPMVIAVGYNQLLGRNTRITYEAAMIDSDGIDNPLTLQDETRLGAILRYDIL